MSKLLDWIPVKAPRLEEVAEELNTAFVGRALKVMNRDLSQTGYCPRGTGTSHRADDLCVFRCEIVNLEQSLEAMWIYAECQRSGNFSTYFLF